MSWLMQYFLNPGFVLPGAALAALPIIIHLLSRLRYKKVRFAAMEFLLQSDELNRRRLIIEQLLLLFLRVLLVLLVMLLIARLVIDPSRMMILRGATTHHVLILDDSLSMRAATDGRPVFDQAMVTLENMLSADDSRSGTLRVTVMTMTKPDRPLVTDRALNGVLVQELIPRLRNISCSYQAVSPVPALAAAENVLSGDGGVAPRIHVITDLRKADWVEHPEVVDALESLSEIDAEVNLIQLSDQSPDNIVLSQLSAETQAVAVGVPWRLNMTLHNHGDRKSSGLRATVRIDGNSLPVKVLVPDMDAHESVVLSHDIAFEAAGRHEVEVRLEDDVFLEDNVQHTVVDVTDKRAVLIVDDEGLQEDAGYVTATFDPTLTGVATQIRTSDVLTSTDLNAFDCIYLLNVRELPADASLQLLEYVRTGGGIAWFPDEQANTTWYNTLLRSEDLPLFPVPLGTVETVLGQADDDSVFQRPVFEDHPVFAVYNIPDNPFADLVQVKKWFQVSDGWDPATSSVPGVNVLARLEDGGAPVVFEHEVGKGRVLTFLISAGRRWSNWPFSPHGYVGTHLLIHQYLQRPSDVVQMREIGELMRFVWPIAEYSEAMDVFLPDADDDGEQSTADSYLRLRASAMADGADASKATGGELVEVSIPQANRPGVYRIKRYPVEGDSEETWMALNVPATESDLTAANAEDIQLQGDLGHVRIIAADTAGGLSASDAGREMRWFLLGLLIIVLICEQLLALRLSFHPEVRS